MLVFLAPDYGVLGGPGDASWSRLVPRGFRRNSQAVLLRKAAMFFKNSERLAALLFSERRRLWPHEFAKQTRPSCHAAGGRQATDTF